MTSSPLFIIVAVDRIESGIVVFESDSGEQYNLPVATLHLAPREGMVYRVPLDTQKRPLWDSAVEDADESRRRLADLSDRLARLRKDSGGDIQL
jgi:hypothetical protein